MAGEVIVDALPYIDQGYDEPGVREAALAMVEEETRRYRPTKNYLEHLPALNITAFETDVMRHEFERMQNRQPMEALSMKRYELPPPPPGKMNDLSAWNQSVENSCAQLEHQATRICNLELMMEFGCESWKSHVHLLIQLVTQAQKQLQALKKQIQEVNWQRKSEQTQGGEKLRALEAQWVGLVSKNYEIEQACVHLEEEIHKLVMAKGEAVEINDVPGVEQEPGVPETSATDTMAMEVTRQNDPPNEDDPPQNNNHPQNDIQPQNDDHPENEDHPQDENQPQNDDHPENENHPQEEDHPQNENQPQDEDQPQNENHHQDENNPQDDNPAEDQPQ